jgi:hypothetical protein
MCKSVNKATPQLNSFRPQENKTDQKRELSFDSHAQGLEPKHFNFYDSLISYYLR